VQAVVFLFANMILCFLWVAIPLNNMYFACGYTEFASARPGPWNCSRYFLPWWTVWLLTLNLLLPYLLSVALLNNGVPEYAKFLYWLAWFMIWYNIIVLLMLLFEWLLYCNGSGSYANTACNDIRWCCVYFSASPTAATWCPNQSPCDPAVSSGNLTRSTEWLITVIASAVWAVLSWAFRRLTKDLMMKGVFGETQ
jgi:hypothetical protein